MIKEISSTKAYSLLQQSANAVLIDVRSTMEYEYVGHPKNSMHIAIKEPPTWKTSSNFVSNVEQALVEKFAWSSNPLFDLCVHSEIFLICRSGKRSGEAALLLEAKNFKNIFNIVDGFEGNKDRNNHRSVLDGWRFNKLPWEQG